MNTSWTLPHYKKKKSSFIEFPLPSFAKNTPEVEVTLESISTRRKKKNLVNMFKDEDAEILI